MAKGVLVVQSQAVEGRDDEFNTWYDEVHVPEVLALPGFVSCRRFRNRSGAGLPYLAVYELEGDDVTAAQTALFEAIGSGKLTMTDTIDGAAAAITIYEQLD